MRLSTDWSTSGSAYDTADGECGGEGGGGGDGGGGDPVKQEPPLPWTINSRSLLFSLRRFKFNWSNIFEGQLVHCDGPPLSTGACWNTGCSWDVANWCCLQSRSGDACAHKEHFWLPDHFVCRPLQNNVSDIYKSLHSLDMGKMVHICNYLHSKKGLQKPSHGIGYIPP